MQNTPTTIERKVMRRRFEGVVASAPGHKTIGAVVERLRIHPKYRKQYTTRRRFQVHDEKNEARVGDKISFTECRPFSKTKRWRLVSILKKADL